MPEGEPSGTVAMHYDLRRLMSLRITMHYKCKLYIA